MEPVAISKMMSHVAMHHDMKDLHQVTSISSRVDLNSQSVAPSIVSQRMDLCWEFPINKVRSQ